MKQQKQTKQKQMSRRIKSDSHNWKSKICSHAIRCYSRVCIESQKKVCTENGKRKKMEWIKFLRQQSYDKLRYKYTNYLF